MSDIKITCVKEMTYITPITYQAPNGSEYVLNHEQFTVGEALFQPHLLGLEQRGIHELIYESLMKCEIDLRKDFIGNIILAGEINTIQEATVIVFKPTAKQVA